MSEECTHNCESCDVSCSSRTNGTPQDNKEKLNPLSSVRKVIGVVSGKGGVGKSIVTSMLAVMFNRKGYHTAVLDADITGPSIPKAFGTKENAMGTDNGILPVTTASGIDIMSVNLLLENETDPVIWRGPILAGTVKQFWSDVIWNGRCSADGIPIPAAGRHCDRHLSAGAGIYDRCQGGQYGKYDGYSDFGYYRKYELV